MLLNHNNVKFNVKDAKLKYQIVLVVLKDYKEHLNSLNVLVWMDTMELIIPTIVCLVNNIVKNA